MTPSQFQEAVKVIVQQYKTSKIDDQKFLEEITKLLMRIASKKLGRYPEANERLRLCATCMQRRIGCAKDPAHCPSYTPSSLNYSRGG